MFLYYDNIKMQVKHWVASDESDTYVTFGGMNSKFALKCLYAHFKSFI